MKSRRTSSWWRVAAGFAAAALAATGFVGTAQAADTGNINPETKGTVTIHKYSETSNKGTNATGHEDETLVPEGAKPLEGVVFTAYKIDGIDLANADSATANQGWDAAKTLTPGSFTVTKDGNGVATSITTTGSDPTTYDLGDGVALPATDGDGIAKSSELSLGAYLFVETDPGLNYITKTVPFVVTVPLPDQVNGEDGSWNYDVHVYPKNSVAAIKKEVNDANAYKVGDTITWPVTVTLPYLADGEAFSRLHIDDTFDPALDYQDVVVKQGDTTFTPDEDYQVEQDTQNSQHYTVHFLAPGIAKLQQGADVVATFSTKVNSKLDDDADGIIPNTAWVTINDSNPEKTNTPESDWGGLQINKYATGSSKKPLAGAEFDVKNGNGDVVAHLTTGDNGYSQIVALKAGKYTLVETKAPAGYDKVNDISVEVKNGAVSKPSVQAVEETQKKPVTLPLTGGTGTLIFSVIGLAIIGGGLVLYVRSRRKVGQNS